MSAPLEKLRSIRRKERLPHTLLFSGPPGSGKRAAAVEMGRDLFCESPRDAAACGSCAACLKTAPGRHPDLYVVQNEAKEIKIEQIREFMRWLFIAPHEAARKVGVIEDADLLNVSSANALLKTLEEPPPHAVIVLLVRNAGNVLQTIRSRSMLVRFPPPAQDRPLPDLEKPDWIEPLERLLAGKTADPEAVFSLSETIAKDRESLPWFFETVERGIRDELSAGGIAAPRAEKLERMFDLALRTEGETMRRYGNVALCLDHFLLQWLP